MKHLKLFETKAERESFVFTADNTPNVNFCEEDDIVGYQGAVAPKDPKLTRWYNGDTLIKEVDVVGELTSSYKEASATRCEIGSNVTSIGGGAFQNCTSLTSVTIPNSVTSIDGRVGMGAFQNCTSLTSVTIPNSVTSIGQCAFMDCPSLTSIVIPNSITYLGNGAFNGCGIVEIYCNAINEPCVAQGGALLVSKNGTLHVAKGGSATTYPTWMDNNGNLGYVGGWTVVDDL